MILGLAALTLIVGLLIYVLSSNPKMQEIGRIMFAFGLLAFLMSGDRIATYLSLPR